MRIIIAEDETRSSRGLHGMIERCGDQYHVIAESSDGQEALMAIRRLHPDVCFTDLRMPVMDGITLIRDARAEGSAVHFVIVSAYEEFDVARQAISLGVDEYLVKPIMQEDVRQVLKAIEKGTLREDVTGSDGGAKSLCDRFPDVHPAVRKALRIIETSYGEKISQKELSETLGITQEYFSTLFARNVGEGFGKFLKSYRIDRAKEMLRGGASVDDTAIRCGIANVKYFNQIFRDLTGETPFEYRTKNRDKKV